jgi:hypothetical protein
VRSGAGPALARRSPLRSRERERIRESETGVGKERKEADKRAPQGNKEMNETHSICKFEIEFTFELNLIQIILPGSKNWNENMRR